MKQLLKLILLGMGLICNGLTCYSQSISSDVISSSGETFISGKINLNWTLGESVVEKYEDGNVIHTQGFHQTFLLNTQPVIESSSNVSLKNDLQKASISVYPNPTLDRLHVKFNNISEDLTLELYNMAGQKLLSREISTKVTQQINMSSYVNGSYLLHVIGSKKTVFQIIKSSK